MNDWEQRLEVSRLKREIGKLNDHIDLNILAITGINAEIAAIRKSGDVAAKGVWLQKYTASSTYKYRKLCIERKGVRFDLLHIPPQTLGRWEKAIERRNTIAKLRDKRAERRHIIAELRSELNPLECRLLEIQPTRKNNS